MHKYSQKNYVLNSKNIFLLLKNEFFSNINFDIIFVLSILYKYSFGVPKYSMLKGTDIFNISQKSIKKNL